MNITAIIVTVVGVSLVMGLLFYLLSKQIKKSGYDNEENKALLEGIRSSFEGKMYTINDRLIQSEERWRDVNHLLIRNEYISKSNTIKNSEKPHYSEFLKANGIVKNDLIVNKKLIFVLTPFNELFWNDYKVIREICTSNGFACKRGDEAQFKGDILPHVLKYVLEANLIIANLNGRSANVMYELGIAHALDKSVILVVRKPEEGKSMDVPVDIKSQRILIYKDENELALMLKRELLNLRSLND